MLEQIKNLKSGECYIVPESDYGKAEVWRINDIFVLFEIPQYGGTPRFCCINDDAELIIEAIENLT